MKRTALAAATACLLALAGCGGGHHTKPASPPPVMHAACPQAANGHGHPGICAPRSQFGIAPTVVPGPVYPDRSNNDPCYCGTAIKAAGQTGLIVKANQGAGYIDPTAAGMVASARAAGLAVGEYDFDQDYTIAEARVFEARLKAAGIQPNTLNAFPAYFDVEYGSFSYTGLVAQIRYLQGQGYRVGIYTGDWYWGPHAGCRWPAGISAWLSGYPNAIMPCGLPGQLYRAHQFTDTPSDLTVFLGSRAQFEAFVLAAPALPICFSHRIPARSCAAAQARVASDWRAAASSERAWRARGCPALVERHVWFAYYLNRPPRSRHAYRAGALAATTRAINARGCPTLAQRVAFFSNAAERLKEAH